MSKNRIDTMNAEILIVDDIPDNLNLLCQTLESEGYNIIAAPSGEIALQIVAQTQPDLILLDIMMPGMDGFETCRRFKSDKRLSDIPVIFITAKDETESLVEGFRVGGIDYITKPFEAEEIGEMPLQLQAKLLRVIEDGSIVPLGGTHEKRVDVRILAATNADLRAKIAKGEFREDLYFRLAAFTVTVPPLRERPADIPLLANHFLNMFATEMAIETPTLSDEALSALMDYAFPGNVRELKNIIERALIESGGSEIQPKHLHFLPARILANSATAKDKPPLEIPLDLQQAEVFLIKRALMQAGGNISEATRLLGITRPTLYRKLAQAGVELDAEK